MTRSLPLTTPPEKTKDHDRCQARPTNQWTAPAPSSASPEPILQAGARTFLSASSAFSGFSRPTSSPPPSHPRLPLPPESPGTPRPLAQRMSAPAVGPLIAWRLPSRRNCHAFGPNLGSRAQGRPLAFVPPEHERARNIDARVGPRNDPHQERERKIIDGSTAK